MINVSSMKTVNPVAIMGALALNGLAHVAKLSLGGVNRVARVAGRVAFAVVAFVVAVVMALVTGRRELAACAAVVGLAMFVAYVTYPRSK